MKQTSPERATENNGGELSSGRGLWFCRTLPCKRMRRPFKIMDIKAPTLAGAALLLCNNATDYRWRDNQ
ncbi:MAG: hypothetical protein ACR2P4_07255 [Gammaproteobacteria bacterium]